MVDKSRLKETLEAVRKLRESTPVARPVTHSESMWRHRKIEATKELLRVMSLPARDWEPEGEELARQLSPLLRTEGSDKELYPVQAMTLHDLYCYDGAIAIIRVGGGKSLITFLAPYVVKAFRPLLIVPGNLKEKTKLHMQRDRFHWDIPKFIRIETYERLGHPDHERLLYDYQPDLIMLDEASRCKNTQAVVTSRISYFLEDIERGYSETGAGTTYQRHLITPYKCKVLALSGTLTNDSILNYFHILKWVLPPERIPLPLGDEELEMWSLALDVDVGELHRVKPGALLEFCSEEEKDLAKDDALKAARKAYRRRLLSTPAIVSTQTPFLGSSLNIYAKMVEAPKDVKEAFEVVRTKWEAPDGFEIQDKHVAAMVAKQLALGFYYKPNPRPPKEYVKAQRLWAKTCRKIISSNRKRIDSEGQVLKAMYGPDSSELGLDTYQHIYEDWKEWQQKFGKLKLKTVWINDYAIKYAAAWMKKHPRGIVWTMYSGFAFKLAEHTKVSYYGSNSVDANGRFIENHPHDTPMIASVSANFWGKNLQYGWSDNLLMGAIASGEMHEQLWGRTHREGQPADTVNCELFVPCIEHVRAFWKAMSRAEFAEDMESSRKLLYADVNVPKIDEVIKKAGPEWREGQML